MRRARVPLAAAVAVLLASCASGSTRHAPASASATPRPAHGAAAAAATATTATKQLPRGGTVILGHYRIVAYYGAPGSGALGVLGSGTPEHAALAIEHRATAFTSYGLRLQPSMELIATVAQRSSGADGDYSAPIPNSQISHYLSVVHRHKMLLILDLQPGRATFLSQAKNLQHFLLDPCVSIALDPEWKVGPNQRPGGGLIGSSSAAGVNAVGRYLSTLVRANHLPDKLMVVHEFTSSMLPDRSKITPQPGVEVAFHADGFGTPTAKIRVYHQLAFPGRPFGAGFKLFLTQDSRVMTAREVMALRPRPDIITYQ
jgi:hypothetical protein